MDLNGLDLSIIIMVIVSLIIPSH